MCIISNRFRMILFSCLWLRRGGNTCKFWQIPLNYLLEHRFDSRNFYMSWPTWGWLQNNRLAFDILSKCPLSNVYQCFELHSIPFSISSTVFFSNIRISQSNVGWSRDRLSLCKRSDQECDEFDEQKNHINRHLSD